MSFFFIDDASGVSSVAFQASATSTSTVITCPTVQLGDVGILFDFSRNSGSPPSQVIPSGFTLITTTTYASFGGFRGTVSYKILDGTESGSSLTGQTGAQADSKVLLVFRPNAPVSSVGLPTWLSELDTVDPTAQSIAASGQQVPLVRLACAADNASVTPSFSAGTFDATVTQASGTGRQIVGYAIQNTSGSNDTVDMSDLGINWLVSGYLRFT